MKVFVWEQIDKATDRWHTEGGLVVFVNNETRNMSHKGVC